MGEREQNGLDVERRVAAIEAREQARVEIEAVISAQRTETDQRLTDAVKRLSCEVHELKSWKLRLQYPFAIVGVLFIGACTALGAYLVKLFTGE